MNAKVIVKATRINANLLIALSSAHLADQQEMATGE
jgi:hypothetical protein